jgi:hypothetical protein
VASIPSQLMRVAFVAPGLMAGCVLLVSPPEGDETCRLDISGTFCGICIVQHCQDAVNDCCADTQCRELLAQVDDCARSANENCEAFKKLSLGKSTGSALSQCVQRECPGRCEAVGTSSTFCLDMPSSAQTACSCSYGEGSNPLVCSPLEFPDTLCCAPEGWPAAGQQCSCKPIGCQPSPDGCICELVDYSSPALARSCEGVYCCAADDTCVCGSTPCPAYHTPVARCSLEVLSCPRQQNRLPSCSVHGS